MRWKKSGWEREREMGGGGGMNETDKRKQLETSLRSNLVKDKRNLIFFFFWINCAV